MHVNLRCLGKQAKILEKGDLKRRRFSRRHASGTLEQGQQSAVGDCIRRQMLHSSKGQEIAQSWGAHNTDAFGALMQCVQISDPWLASAVLDIGTKRPDLIDKPRGWPLPIYDCFDRVRFLSSLQFSMCRHG